MKKQNKDWKKEFEKRFLIRRESGLWVNPDTFTLENVYDFLFQFLDKNENYKGQNL